MPDLPDLRPSLRQIFQHALAEASIEKAFERHISYDRGVLRIMEELYGLPGYDRVFVVSIGKAAHTMVKTLTAQVGRGLQGIVAGSTAASSLIPGFGYFEGGHPVPNAESLRGATAVLRSLKSLTDQSLVIYLNSGGGSAVLEKPINGDISLPE